MVSTTGEQHAYFELDDALAPLSRSRCLEALVESVDRIQENCEPALCTVLFMGGAGGSLRAGVTENPGTPDAFRQTDALTIGDSRRRAGLCVAGWRHHDHGRCDETTGEFVRLCADAGHRRAH